MTSKTPIYQIAIDGPVAAGKGTAAKKLATQLDFLYVDTGAMYRTACLYFLEKQLPIDADHETALAAALEKAALSLHNVTLNGQFFTQVTLDGRDVSARIREQDVDANVSAAASLPAIRQLLVRKQQALAEECSVVMEGRDIATKVLPNATLKVFLTASLEVRAQRRFQQLHPTHPELTLADIAAQIQARDDADTHRASDPLQVAPDATLCDTSTMTIDETVAKLLALFNERLTTLNA